MHASAEEGGGQQLGGSSGGGYYPPEEGAGSGLMGRSSGSLEDRIKNSKYCTICI